MRTALALCLAVALFASAALWHADRGGRKAAEASVRPPPPRADAPDAGAVPAGWVEIVLGAPSGTDPMLVPAWYRRRGSGEPVPAAALTDGVRRSAEPGFQPTPRRPPDFELEVAPGQILGRIAAQHYGTSRPGLVDALARYNGLTSPDRLREGQVLLLPPLEVLEALGATGPDRP